MMWSPGDLGDQTGKRFLVTGVTSGIGTITALELAKAGGEVVLAARSRDKLAITRRQIEDQVPGAHVDDLIVDLSEMTSVRRAAHEASALGPIDCLVNNAGVMATPFVRTGDGFELQWATNYLGPFLLTGLLLPQLIASGAGRVVCVGSQAHRMARSVPVSDPRSQVGRYSRWRSYARSKLADLMFVQELEERLRQRQLPVKAIAAHPGYTATELMASGRAASGESRRAALFQKAFELLGQPTEMGAWPSLAAATADLPGSTYLGPSGWAEMRGRPTIVRPSAASRNPEMRRTLWEVSEQATGITYP